MIYLRSLRWVDEDVCDADFLWAETNDHVTLRFWVTRSSITYANSTPHMDEYVAGMSAGEFRGVVAAVVKFCDAAQLTPGVGN
jgi:hypothetical protein